MVVDHLLAIGMHASSSPTPLRCVLCFPLAILSCLLSLCLTHLHTHTLFVLPFFFFFSTAEAERMRLSGAAITGSLRQKASASLAAHESGMVAMTQDDLARQRQSRRAEAAVTAARLSERQFAASPSKSEGSPAKPSRLDSMRSALGLNRLGSVLPKRGSSETESMSAAQQPRERSADRGWTVVTGAGAVSDGDNAGNKSWKQRMFPSRKS
jgi:hypothetical protein